MLRGLLAGRFDVDRLAGEGGMGAVYRAWDRHTGAPVALKLLARDRAHDLERFAREAELLSRLDHPGIVRYVAHGRLEQGEPYLAMEWLEGESLSERLGRELCTIGEATELAWRIAEALSVAHERGIVHRDLKPGNVFLVDRSLERVKVLDFGIARSDEPGRQLTETGTVLGTPGYLAPEQARGSRDIGPSADVYALGCVVFRCATGRTPFTGDNAIELLYQAATSDAPLLSSLRGDVAPELDALLARMLARDPAARPQHGRAVAAELLALLRARRDVPVPSLRWEGPAPTREPTAVTREAPTPPPIASTRNDTKKGSRWRYLAPAALVLLVLGGGVAWYSFATSSSGKRGPRSAESVAQAAVAPPLAPAAKAAAATSAPLPSCRADWCEPVSFPDPKRVEVVALLARASGAALALTPGAKLARIDARGLRGGLVDLTLPGSVATFVFSQGNDSVAVRVELGQLAATIKKGERSAAVVDPECTVEQAWKRAVDSGLVLTETTIVSYGPTPGAGASWRVASGTRTLDLDGKRCAALGVVFTAPNVAGPDRYGF